MNEGQVPSAMKSVTLGLFEQQFMKTGTFKNEYGAAIRRIFDIKPKCSGEETPVSGEEVNTLSILAGAFVQDVEAYLEKKSEL
jgi:uncharacterized protein (UPF0332 family)